MPYVEYDEVQATCSDCGRTFLSEEALAAHRAQSHGPEDVTVRPSRRPPRRARPPPTEPP
jgi:hypothetical protein